MRAFAILPLACSAALAAATPSNPGFESRDSGWSFFAHSPDSARATIVSNGCHGGSLCDSIHQRGSQDWALTPNFLAQPVVAGEIWEFSAWVEIDSLPGSLSLSFVDKDSTGNVRNWSLSPSSVSRTASGWTRYTATASVSTGCASLQPRIAGWGRGDAIVDDVSMVRIHAKPTGADKIVLSTDSLRVVVDPLGLRVFLRDSLTGDTLATDPVAWFATDSVRKTADDSATIFGTILRSGLPVQVGAKVKGGALLLALHADSAASYSDSLLFPGPVGTRSGQKLAMPRGTGMTISVTDPTTSWIYTTAPMWYWQVSMGLTGATDGARGFVLSTDQPWNTLLQWRNSNGLLRPYLYHVPAKERWGHDRTVLLAPLRSGGWAEMALRYRARLDFLGRTRPWKTKIADRPVVDSLRGALDLWFYGSWPGSIQANLDTLRLYGMDRALVGSWSPSVSTIDSLRARGILPSAYDYFVCNSKGSGPMDHEVANGGVSLNKDGSPYSGGNADPTFVEISTGRQVELAKALLPADLAIHRLRAKFLDVLLSEGLFEDYNPRYPANRADDAANRVALLGVHQAQGLLVGSEQTRDFAHAVVDWAEGPMSLTTGPSSGSNWSKPAASSGIVDSLNFEPSRRIPLLQLVDHDVVATTWHSGDGLSKIPSRWDDKDAWTILYGALPLVVPDGKAAFDSLRPRFMRSIVALSSAHLRYGFEKMDGFEPLSPDWHLQKTSFANGWTVVANFDDASRAVGSDTLAPKGYLATNGLERIERIRAAGATRTRVRLSDRWFLDPEGVTISVDGIASDGAVFLKRIDDTTLHLALVGNQTSIQIRPSALPWRADSIRAYVRGSTDAIGMAPRGSGWFELPAPGGKPFFTLHGKFAAFNGSDATDPGAVRPKRSRMPEPRAFLGGGRLLIRWTQAVEGSATFEVVRPDGSVVVSRNFRGVSGANQAALAGISGLVIFRLRTPDGAWTKRIAEVR